MRSDFQVADQQSAIGADTGETPTREMRHNPVSVHERPSYSRNFKDLRQMMSQVRIHTSQPASLHSHRPNSGLGPIARKPPRSPGFCVERGGGCDRERPVIAGNAAPAHYYLCRPFWWSHNPDWMLPGPGEPARLSWGGRDVIMRSRAPVSVPATRGATGRPA